MSKFNNFIEIGADLKELREKFNLTQKEVAELFDTSINSISKLENGHTKIGLEKWKLMKEYFFSVYPN